MSVLVAEALSKSYHKRRVVKHVSLQVESGEVVGLLGPNGAGKTTCFYLLAGMLAAESGTIALDGRAITHLPMHARARLGIGYLPQEASIFRKLSVADNILAVLQLRAELSSAVREERLEALLQELHISHLRAQLGISLSGGERRRVEIARALAAEPRFILLDEPFAGVDPLSVMDIQRIVRHLQARAIGILITDHNVRETLGVCDRAYIINEGAVIAAGTPQAVLADEHVRQVYLGHQFRL